MSMIPKDAAGDCTTNRAKNEGNRTKILCHLNCSFSSEVWNKYDYIKVKLWKLIANNIRVILLELILYLIYIDKLNATNPVPRFPSESFEELQMTLRFRLFPPSKWTLIWIPIPCSRPHRFSSSILPAPKKTVRSFPVAWRLSHPSSPPTGLNHDDARTNGSVSLSTSGRIRTP